MQLGTRLRRLREASGISREAAGYSIRASKSKISRMELGRVGFKERDVSDLLNLYGVSDKSERERLLEMARQSNAPSWWQQYAEGLPAWFQTYLGLEESASLIRTYQGQLVPDLLQTADYARAVLRREHPDASHSEIEQRVELRMQRQDRLGAALWAVIDEAALLRPIGGLAVMREQVEHLIRLAELPNVTIQIMPLQFGGHPAEVGAFTLLRFPQPDVPDVVYVETPTGAQYLKRLDEVDDYRGLMEWLCMDGIVPADFPTAMDDILRQLEPPVTISRLRTATHSAGTRAERTVLKMADTPFGTRILIGEVVGDAPPRMADDVALAFGDLAEQEPMLAGVAERLNTLVAGSGHREVFVNALLVTVRDWEDQVEIVRCGHPPPLMLHGSRALALDVAPDNPPLGRPDTVDGWCEPTAVPYRQDDRLLLHTGGASQVLDSRGRPYPLAERAGDLLHHDLDTALVRLAEDLLGHAAGPLEHGVTFLMVQRDPEPLEDSKDHELAARMTRRQGPTDS